MLLPIYVAVTLITFLLLHAIPGDPAIAYFGQNPGVPPEVIEAFRQKMGLDQPVYIQYFHFFVNTLQLDLGTNIRTGRPISAEILARLPNTIALAVFAMVIGLSVAIPVGTISAVKRYSLIDKVSMVLSSIFVSTPNFWLALTFAFVIGYQLRLLPISGSGGIEHVILPSLALGITNIGWILRLTRSSMLDVFRQDYIRTAKSKGLAERTVIFKHGLKNAILEVITMVGLRFSQLLGGAIVVEQVFAYPGIGTYALLGVRDRNYPVVLGTLVMVSMTFALINIIIDLLYAYFDPRIRYG